MTNYSPDIAELVPKNFSLEKYKNASTLDAYQWYWNVENRATIEYYLNGGRDHPFDDLSDVESIIRCNEKNISRGFGIKDISGWFGDIEDIYKLLVNSMTLFDHKYVSKDIEFLGVNENYPKTEINSFSSLGAMGCALVSVDLNAPDEMLVEGFKRWLAEARLAVNFRPKQKYISDSVLRRWCINKAIEYLDLSQWHRLRNRSLFDYQAAAILFPNDLNRNTTEVVTKTIRKKLIPEMLENQTRSALLFQGMEAERK